jgi:hypothetical protein
MLGNTEGDDDENLRGRVWICIHPSLYTSSNWNSSLFWETNASNASFLICPRLQQDILASSPIDVALSMHGVGNVGLSNTLKWIMILYAGSSLPT